MSNDIVIRAEAISKRYRISHQARQTTLCETLPHLARQAWQRLRGAASPTREDFWALRDINFEIKRGEVVGIIGRNGAGKSTLLKILSRITDPTSGRITLKGRVASLLEVGTGFHPELTGRDNIYLNGAILGMSRAEIRQKFDEIVAFAEVERFLDTPVKRYSSGMYVRLAFSVAAHLEPEILIIDEVLAVGDAQFQAKCLGKMREIAQSSERTVLFVSHNLQLIQKICTAGLFLQSGRATRLKPIREALRDYMQTQHDQGAYSAGLKPGQSIALADIRIAHTSGEPALNIQANTRTGFILTLISERPRERPRITVAFTNSDGLRVFALASSATTGVLRLEPGINWVEVVFTVPAVFPDTFSLDVGVYAEDGETLTEVFGASYITLTDQNAPTDSARKSFGVIRADSNWTQRTN